MKNVLENYGQIAVGVIITAICLGVLNFTIAASFRPNLEIVPLASESPIVEVDLAAAPFCGVATILDPLELVGASSFPVGNFVYLETLGDTIYYKDDNYNQLMFKSAYANGNGLDYTTVDYGDYHCRIDKVQIIAVVNSQVMAESVVVIIEEE